MWLFFSPFRRGKCCPFFFFCFISGKFGVLCLFLLFFSSWGRCWEKNFGSELLFLGVEVGLAFFDGVLPRFLFQVLAIRSRNCSKKILLMSGLPFLGSFSLSWFSVVVVSVFLRDTAQVVTGHTPHAPFWSVSFVFVPAALVTTRSGRASFLSGVLSGCLSGPRAFWRFCRILSVLWGLETTRPF